MDWLRSAIGVAPSSPPPKKTNATLERYRQDSAQSPYENRSEKFARAQLMRIEMLREELNDERAEAQKAVNRGDRPAAQQHLTRAKKVQQELTVLQKKYDNMMQTQTAISNANANVAQGVLVQESAQELQSAVEALEEIDLDGAMDTLQDSAALMQEQDARLTEPIFGSLDVDIEYEVDDELDRLMREKQERDAAETSARLPDLHAPESAPSNVVPPREEIGEIRN